MRRWLLVLCVVAVLAPACGGDASTDVAATATPGLTPFATAEPPDTVAFSFEGGTVTAEIAATASARALGLMHRQSLDTDAGMLFLFPRPDSGGFWMKNTLIPLQIAYMQQTAPGTFEVLALRDMVPCTADPCTVYKPGVSYDSTLEVNEDWFDRHDVEVGSVAEAEGDLPDPL